MIRKPGPAALLRLKFAGATDTGKARRHNEDSFGCDDALRLAVVADGMGGLSGGDVASRLVVETVLDTVRRVGAPTLGLDRANQRILDARATRGGPMGSTAVVLHVVGAEARINWVGDSRAYLWRDDELRRLTRDHSFVQELQDVGAITPNEAAVHPNRNIVTRAIGVAESADLKIDQTRLDLRAGDRLLLCTDGLHGYLGEAAIGDVLRETVDCDEIAGELVRRTLDRTEAGDNVTVVCVCVEGPD